MTLKKIAVIAIVVVVVSAGAAAAAPGNAPENPSPASDREMSENSQDSGPDANASTAEDHDVTGNANAAVADDASHAHDQGPNVDLPAQVPDHVAQIHDLIRQFLDGSLDGSLGDAISDIAPSNDDAENGADA